jgi:dTDP-4-amino-4,6-dideoxygalactose transaminase
MLWLCVLAAALHIALEAIGLQPEDEILNPTTTFTATGEVVKYLGVSAETLWRSSPRTL